MDDIQTDEITPGARQDVNYLLNRLFLHTTPHDGSLISEAECLNSIQKTYKIIKIDGVGELSIAGVHQDFLKAASFGHLSLALHTLGLKAKQNPPISCRSLSITQAIKSRTHQILSPFTGQIEQVDTSLGHGWYLLKQNDQYCMAAQIGSPMVAVDLETFWVIPESKLILYISNGCDINFCLKELAKSMSLWLSFSSEMAKYINSNNLATPRKICLTDFWCPHMSHNLWNIQTGWANIFDRCDVNSIDRFLLFTGQNFFGPLEELYQDKISDTGRVKYIANEKEIFLMMLQENLLLFSVKDEFFTKSFADRVINFAKTKCSDEFLSFVEQLKANTAPLVVTTIRLDNREWIEQVSGFPSLFSKIRENYPKLGVIFDGLSSDTAKGWTTGWMSLESELTVADKIREQLPQDMEVAYAVGKTFYESIVLCDAADLFIAPSGSGMALYKWLSNIPGLAFSNKAVLDETSPHKWPLRVWHDPTFRTDITPTFNLNADLVTDEPSDRNHVSRNNFHLDWQNLVAPSLEVIKFALESNYESRNLRPQDPASH